MVISQASLVSERGLFLGKYRKRGFVFEGRKKQKLPDIPQG